MLPLKVNVMSSSKLVLILLAFTTLSRCEYFTALVHLEKLLYTEEEIIKTLDQYLEIEEQRLQKVRWLQGQFSELHQRASNSVETFLSNPVNAYLLVKRLTSDWREAESLAQGQASKDLIEHITSHREDLQFPDEEDLNGAAIALMRLQDTYKLDASSLASGDIAGTRLSPKLTAGDCCELGKQAYNVGQYHYTMVWMAEALKRLKEEKEPTADQVEVLEFIAYSAYMEGDPVQALELTRNISQLEPNHPRALGNLKYYEQAVGKQRIQKRGDDGDDTNIEEPEVSERDKPYVYSHQEQYEKLCRGEKVERPVKEVLSCRYFTNDNPVLLLQPVREEELHLNPRIVVYHNIISEKEMDVIKALAQPKLKRATVQTDEGAAEFAKYRISKSAWLANDEDAVIARVSRRVEDVTGLNLNTSESLQVVNYGIGGHYEPHTDFYPVGGNELFKSFGMGNRIATWLNYMSDVEAGGATVFPELGVSVRPIKGSAAFWYNLFRNGNGDYRTRHAACPVLLGSKWVSNKWMHEHGQEFRRPCSLNPLE